MITQAMQPYVNTINEPPIYFLGLPTILRATAKTTNGGFGLVEQVMPAGFASPYHTHRLEDEAFYVLEGQIAFVTDGRWTIAGPGTYVFGPRHIAHGFRVLGNAPARMLLLCSPGGFDQFVVEMSEPAPAPPNMAKLMALAAKYSVDIHGPLPEGPGDEPRSEATSMRQAVAETRNQHIAAVNAGDAQAATAVFAPAGVMLPPGQPALEGATAINAWFTHVFANFRIRDFTLVPGDADERGDVVVEYGNWSATFAPRDGSASVPARGTYLTVYARIADGSVRMIRDTFNGLPA